jgi:hypothetical protein
MTVNTPNQTGGKDSLLIPSGKTTEKRLSFKEGASIEEVVRNYTSNT